MEKFCHYIQDFWNLIIKYERHFRIFFLQIQGLFLAINAYMYKCLSYTEFTPLFMKMGLKLLLVQD